MNSTAFLAAILYVAAPISAQTPRVRDSAGITIVENPSAPASRLPPFNIGERPILQIGAKEGDPSVLWSGIAAATRFADGSLVVADRGSAEIRIFDASGRFVRKLGGKGAGPGKFQNLAHVWLHQGDSVGAWDGGLRRFTVFSRSGASLRTFEPAANEPGLFGFVRGVMADGSFFGYRFAFAPPPPEERVLRDTLKLGHYKADGAWLGAVGRFLGLERIMHGGGSMRDATGVMRGGAFSIKGVPFARETLLRTGSDCLYAGDGGASYEISCYDRSGQLKRLIRLDRAPRQVTPALIAQFRSEAHVGVDRGPGTPSRPNPDPNVAVEFFPKTLPAYSAMLVDGAQRLWVRDYPVPGESQPRWNVFGRDGRHLGSVPTPAGVEVLEIGTTYLIGVWRDEDDVEYVRVYALSPAPQP